MCYKKIDDVLNKLGELIMKEIIAGRATKGDIQLRILGDSEKGNIFEIKSSIALLYKDKIEEQLISDFKAFGIDGYKFEVIDDGALPYVIRARVDAIARKLGKVENLDCVVEYSKTQKKAEIEDRLRRSRLYLPGNNPYLVQNAWLFGADVLILDLEDSVPPAEKEDTRILVKHLLMSMSFGKAEKAVRINPLWTHLGEKDLMEIVPACPDIIFIPKAESKKDIIAVDKIVKKIQAELNLEHKIGYFPIIESAKGVEFAYEIATASKDIVAIAFGAEDYTKDIGVERTVEGRETLFARMAIVNAAKAAGIQASDTVFSDLDNDEGFIANVKDAKALGFDSKGLIHPGQIYLLHEIFSPSKSEIEYAVKVIEAAKEAEKKGAGVVSLGRKMIDPPVVARAFKVVDLAKRLGLV